MKKIIVIVCINLFLYSFLNAQQIEQAKYELTGKVSFDVSHMNGFIGNAALTIGDGGTGLYQSAMVADTSLTTHTLYMPLDLSPFGGDNKLPIVVFGNGGCRNGSVEIRNLLSEVASHGFLVIAVGPFQNSLFETDSRMSDPQSLIDGIDWAIRQNRNDESQFYGRIDVDNIAVMGQSCGGLMAMAASKDERVTTVVMLNSGLFPESQSMPQEVNTQGNGLPLTPKSYLEKLKPSIAYFIGGETDIATPNALDDFKYLNNVPVVIARYDFSDIKVDNQFGGYGHYPATYREDNGGDFAKATVAWLKWQLNGDTPSSEMFKAPYKLEENSKWSVVKKNID